VTAIALAFAASVAWGIGDFLGGVTSRRLATLAVLAVSEVAGWVLLGVLVAASGDEPLGASATAAAVAAGVAGLVGLGALYQGMAVGAIGVVAPVSTLAALIPLTYGLARGERPGAIQLLGAAAILAGVALVSREPGPAGARVAAGVGFALLAALGFGLYFVFIDVASESSAPWAVFVSRGVASVVAVAAALSRGVMRAPVRLLPVLVVIGLFDAGANALLAAALNRGYTSIVSVVASLYPVVTVLLAATVLRERVAPLRAAGIGAALVGVACVSAG
jgi:drug/metabolite transporter (DMT)-like permease